MRSLEVCPPPAEAGSPGANRFCCSGSIPHPQTSIATEKAGLLQEPGPHAFARGLPPAR